MKYITLVTTLTFGLITSTAYALGPVSSQVWTNAYVTQGTVSPSIITATTDPSYTIYFKPTTIASQDYSVYVQTSPDGTNWATLSQPYISVSKYNPANTTYQMNITVKALRVRLVVFPTNLTYSATVNGWIVN